MEFNRDGLYYTILTPVALRSGLVTFGLVGQPTPPWRPMQQRPMQQRPMQQRPMRHWLRRLLVPGVALWQAP
jgi:hypothetical protein